MQLTFVDDLIPLLSPSLNLLSIFLLYIRSFLHQLHQFIAKNQPIFRPLNCPFETIHFPEAGQQRWTWTFIGIHLEKQRI